MARTHTRVPDASVRALQDCETKTLTRECDYWTHFHYYPEYANPAENNLRSFAKGKLVHAGVCYFLRFRMLQFFEPKKNIHGLLHSDCCTMHVHKNWGFVGSSYMFAICYLLGLMVLLSFHYSNRKTILHKRTRNAVAGLLRYNNNNSH